MHGKPRYVHYVFFTVILTLGLGIALVLPWLANLQGIAAGVQPINNNGNVPDAGAVYHISKTGNGSTGLDWTNAFTNPLAALNIAISGDEIWVATGVYTPGVNEEDSFALVNGVAMYGGFAGTEILKSDRDWESNPTILSGDIDGDDTNLNGVVRTTDHIVGDNSYHVITATGVVTDTILDGFTITAGKADSGSDEGSGGGFYCNGEGTGNVCSPTLRNLAFYGNYANDYGGAMFNIGSGDGRSNPKLQSVLFSGNEAYDGGAVYNEAGNQGISSPYMENVSFISNSAKNGGALFNYGYKGGESSPVLDNALFSGNWAEFDGGAIINQDESRPVFTNVTISGNRAGVQGGGIINSNKLELRNSILWDNQVNGVVGTITSTLYTFGTITITHSLVQGTGPSGGSWIADSRYVDGMGNIDQDPRFVIPVDPAVAPTTAGDLRLRDDSPARDIGDNIFISVPIDLDANPRIDNLVVDMGGYEYQVPYIYDISLPLAIR